MIERGFLVAEVANLKHQKAIFLGKASEADIEATGWRAKAEQADGAIQSYEALIAKLDKDTKDEAANVEI